MIDPAIDSVLREAAGRLKQGNEAAAREHLQRAIATNPNAAPLHALAGLLACQSGDLEIGVASLGEALRLAPGDPSTRVNLAMALAQLGRLDEAAELAMEGPEDDPRLARLRAFALLQRGAFQQAVADYERTVAAFPTDFESWNNLGNAHAALQETDAAVRAFRRAISLRPEEAAPRLNAASALGAAGRAHQQRTFLRESARELASSAELHYQLGIAEANQGDLERAEAAWRSAITRDRRHIGAYSELGLLLETQNRLDDLAALIDYAERQEVPEGQLAFLKAWQLRRRKDFVGALAMAERIDLEILPARRHHLLGEIHDRLGNADEAFRAFDAMNAAAAATTPPAIRAEGEAYLEEIRQYTALARREPAGRWAAPEPAAEPPVFIAGFPRSGTTLTDTLLMGIPGAHVMEELAAMRAAEVELGSPARLDGLRSEQVLALRQSYVEAAMDLASPPAQGLLVDKHPFHMVRMPLIRRLYPDAKIIFVQRHPCDVLLSCYFANFRANRATVHLQTLEGAARLYDLAYQSWFAAREALTLDVHVLRYENMVEDLEGEMRELLRFLGVPWNDAVLDHQSSAARRGLIKTASYAQVTEPIYTRSVGRWGQYRRHLEPILPLLAPWVERLGYTLDP